MFDRVIFLLCLAVFAASAEFSIEEAADFADFDGDGFISDDEFNMWNHVSFEYRKTSTIMSMTGEIPVSTFISVLENFPSNSGYNAQDVVNFADKNKNGVISADEFDRWFRLLPPGNDKTATVLMFTGDIPVDKFKAVLQQEADASSFDGVVRDTSLLISGYISRYDTGFSVQQAVDYANANHDDVIDADEFNTWYHGVELFSGEHLKAAVTGDDGVITVEGFKNTLAWIQANS